MSSFSRGFFLRSQCLRTLPKPSFFGAESTTLSSAPRTLSTSQLFQASNKQNRMAALTPKGKTSKLQPSPSKRSPSTNSLQRASPHPVPTYTSLSSSLAAKSSRVLLYRAPLHTLYISSAYGAAAVCFSYSTYALWVGVIDPWVEMQAWTTYTYLSAATLAVGAGIYCLVLPRRLISTITAVPFTTTSGSRTRSLQLHVELRKLFPRPGSPKVVVAEPQEVSLNHAISFPRGNSKEVQRLKSEADRAWLEKNKRKSILTLPFRQINHIFYKLFITVLRLRSGDGFLKLRVKDKNYKLDVSGGWALEEGRVLDKLVKVR